MSSCLGLFIQSNLIKYAKISKEHDVKKVEAFGVRFFEDGLNETIAQIINETYSYNIPISVNINGESYNYFDMFALLSKKDLQKAIKTEFDSYCAEKGFNPNVFETRYAITPYEDDNQKLKVIHVSNNKIELNKREQLLSGYKIAAIAPVPMIISNLQEFEERQNAIIVNIEDHTTITTIIDQKINSVQRLESGSKEILENINIKENSYSKSYEVCKNTTIYTSEGSDLQETEVSYLEDIMPVLYNIVGQVKKIINETDKKIDRVYITGTAALINNVDLYFQEYLEDVKCDILRPKFITNTKDISIKDYIEVNSAISLALLGIGEGLQNMNFKKQSLEDKLPEWMTKDIGGNKNKPPKGKKIKFDLGEGLDKVEKNLIRGTYTFLLLFIIYCAFAMVLNNQLRLKQDEVDARIASIKSQISLAKADDNKIKIKTNEYTSLIKNLQEINDKASERLKTRNAIPNLLNQIMFIVPENVQITSIQNTSDKHIEITAQSDKYEQLGYFKAKIKQDNILKDVISTAGQKDGEAVTVKIEGELP
ncbi:MAG: hypothetical protein J6I85_01010 [Clostridia bacterium]|nr:hypothetical protein [Clostridia bacterium]